MSPRGRIGRFGRVPRRPDHWASPHERARVRAAERLAAPLPPSEAAWLEAHLADCPSCRGIADAYVDDRLALRELRDAPPEPPRDLWARTATRIEQESASRNRAPRANQPPARRSLPSLGVLSGLAVVTVVVIATAVSGGFLRGITQDASSPSIALASQAVPQATAFPVPAGKVHWLGAIAEDGVFAYNVADVRAVCPPDRRPVCAPFEDGHAKRVTLAATPRFVYQSPIADQAIVVGTDATGADAVIVLALPTPDPTPSPTPEPSPTEPSASPSAGDSGQPSASIDSTPTAETPSPSPSVLVTSFPSDVPIESAVVASPSESGSPEPTAGPVAIITDVVVVGRTAAYSPDGTWFAFTARPADGSAGPDIYVWQVGQPQAYPLTTDHASVFASWVGGNILGSRVGTLDVLPSGSATPEPSLPESNQVKPSPHVDPTIEIPPPIDLPPVDGPSALGIGQTVVASQAPDASQALQAVIAAESMPTTFLLDPATGAEVPLADAEWHPAVDPTGLAVVAWQGTVGVTDDGLTAAPANGNLVIHPFHGPLESDEPSAPPTESGTPEPSPTISVASPPEVSVGPSASATASASASASPTAEVVRDFPTQVVAAGPIADFDARWDDTGSWLAIWIADPVNPGLGRLSLFHFDPYSGMLDRPLGAPQDMTALEGFSIGHGRLAWVSPPGQGGEGSRIQIAAWADGQVGSIESIPVDGAIVVQ